MIDFKDDDKYSSWNGISDLKIGFRQLSNSENIFSNGRHRILIDVHITPKDKNDMNISISNKILSKNTWLIDYNTGEKLSFDVSENDDFTWGYTDEPNEFTAIIIPSSVSLMNSREQASNSIKKSNFINTLTYYVYCAPTESNHIKQIGVLVQAPDGEHSISYGGDFDGVSAFLQLTAISEVFYDMSHIKMDSKIITTHYGEPGWIQENTYVSISPNDQYGKRHIMKLEYDGGKIDSIHQLYSEDEYHTVYYAHFLWSLGKEKTVSIGNAIWFNLPVNFPIDITVRQKVGFLCFTVILINDPTFPEVKDYWYPEFYITIYDQYGNKGRFLIAPNNKNDEEKEKIHLVDS
ncbi:hypothetical protein [Xenorhabdus stockiae]|uniref:hypothetical protein n=1 Tax=Xenorhabdus stockiae TaxID=351614 RepID=UPI0040645A3C